MRIVNDLPAETVTLLEEILADLAQQAERESDFRGVPNHISIAQTYWEIVLDGSIIEPLHKIQSRHAKIKGQ